MPGPPSTGSGLEARSGDHALEIRELRVDDVLSFIALRRAVHEEGCWFVTEPEECEDDPRAIRAFLSDLTRSENSFGLLATASGRVRGYLVVQGGVLRRMRHVAHLEIMVRASWRGRGIGHALMTEGIARARANPLLEKLSLAVFADNGRAIALYRRHGFEVEGRRRGEYRLADGRQLDDLLMALDVQGSSSPSEPPSVRSEDRTGSRASR
jgi:ribosomal protein S18 acetylase RimI-like enzyme